MDHRQDNTLSRCPARFILFSGTSRCGDQSVDSHPETDGHGIDEILDRKYQRQRFHGILTDPGNKITVYYIIKRIYQHRQDHGHSHSEEKRKDRLLLHESFIHIYIHSFRSGTKRYENVPLSLFFLYNSSCRELGILQITGR